jgi:hypothetical protein
VNETETVEALRVRIEALSEQNKKLREDIAAGYLVLGDAAIRSLAARVADQLLNHRDWKNILKQMLLAFTIQLEDQRRAGIINSFFACCEGLGIQLRMDELGKVKCTNLNRMEPELRIVFTMYRVEIMHRLKRIRDLSILSNGRVEEKF